ncbi:MAG: 4Fe-4S binding protein [Bacteroidetes bacterium]|nr:4Fe-4S binding protein [Bacteroidota bacterium]
MKRKIIRIDEEKCNGCGLCIPNCQEGALQVIDGKARLISDLFCDGLGACMGHCPEDAITIEEREAEPYNERLVMETISKNGKNTILAHLAHLRDHNEQEYLKEAISYLKENNIDMSENEMNKQQESFHGCPGSAARDFRIDTEQVENAGKETISSPADAPSELRQWPVQLHLLNPLASYFKNADVVLAADCAAFAMGNFHARYLKGRSVAIACPKLDTNKESYLEKLTSMMKDSKINTLQVVIMEVPCCGGLVQMAETAKVNAGLKVPIKVSVISVQGEVLEDEWI